MRTSLDLQHILERIDHKSYPAYKDTAGSYEFRDYVLSIDHVQSDPFASPSDVSIHIAGSVAAFPKEFYERSYRKVALEDLLVRTFYREAGKYSYKAEGSGKSGLIQVSRPTQEILERSSCKIHEGGGVVFRLKLGFPAFGRTINSRELSRILFSFLPECARSALCYKSFPAQSVNDVIDLADDQDFIRGELERRNLAAFVADGAILPRESGISSRPMQGAVAFVSPESLRVRLDLPHRGQITGMGIPRGITMITGGGYHGKSTLIRALELGVYNHIRGDGREYVITDASAVKLRAEDGRSITGVDISMFIRNLPNGRDTSSFSSEDASGSTSQAANVVEAMESGAKVFLIDEDTSATNFMIRDELMQRVISGDSEPIIPFIDRVVPLFEQFGISTILVAGSCGSYFHRAGVIIQMKDYEPLDITRKAKEAAALFPLPAETHEPPRAPDLKRRLQSTKKLDERVRIKTFGLDGFSIDREDIDLRYVEQLVDPEQVSMLGQIMRYALPRLMNGRYCLQEILDEIEARIEKGGLEAIYGGRYMPAGFSLPRRQEIAATINRFRRERSTSASHIYKES